MNVTDIRKQRDQALACMIISLCILVAVIISVFARPEKQAMEKARSDVALHEMLFRQSNEGLEENQKALISVKAALETIELSHNR